MYCYDTPFFAAEPDKDDLNSEIERKSMTYKKWIKASLDWARELDREVKEQQEQVKQGLKADHPYKNGPTEHKFKVGDIVSTRFDGLKGSSLDCKWARKYKIISLRSVSNNTHDKNVPWYCLELIEKPDDQPVWDKSKIGDISNDLEHEIIPIKDTESIKTAKDFYTYMESHKINEVDHWRMYS
jgi:hypothetical protein